MDNNAFKTYLRKGGRSPSAIQRILQSVSQFEKYLQNHCNKSTVKDAIDADLTAFVKDLDTKKAGRAKSYLWALWYYFDWSDNPSLRKLASKLRSQRIKRKPFQIRKFRGVSADTGGNPKHRDYGYRIE